MIVIIRLLSGAISAPENEKLIETEENTKSSTNNNKVLFPIFIKSQPPFKNTYNSGGAICPVGDGSVFGSLQFLMVKLHTIYYILDIVYEWDPFRMLPREYEVPFDNPSNLLLSHTIYDDEYPRHPPMGPR